MEAVCMKCGEVANYRVDASIDDKHLPIIYLCRRHANQAEDALRPEKRGCAVCGRAIKRAAEVTIVNGANYCPECRQSWREWEKQRYADVKAAREPSSEAKEN